MNQQERFVKELSVLGNLFLILTLPELRRQGITYLSFYALQRAIEVSEESARDCYPQSALRNESGFADYETSRACSQLKKGGLIELTRAGEDARERVLVPTPRGKRILAKIMATASQRLFESIGDLGRFRRIQEATAHLRKAQRALRGPIQLSFFEKELRRTYPKELRSFSPRTFK